MPTYTGPACEVTMSIPDHLSALGCNAEPCYSSSPSSPEPQTLAPPRPMEMEMELEHMEEGERDPVWSYPSCPDVEECRLGLHSCHPFATCVNTPTSFECHCERGYTGDGTLHCNQT